MITEKILDLLYELGSVSSDVFFTDYHTSYKKMWRRIYGVKTKEQRKQDQEFETGKQERKERQRFLNMLCYLHENGLVERKENKHRKSKWRITHRGIEKLKFLKKKQRSKLEPFSAETVKEDALKIVIFDIPESEKRKRNWLRRSLQNLNFFMLQKSVWIGKSKLPEKFLEKLQELKILSFVHIFTVHEKGTIDFNVILQRQKRI